MKIDNEIKNIDKVICRHIANSKYIPRGMVSQDILAQLRNFVEHIMLKFYANGKDIENTYPNICNAISFVKKRGDLKDLSRFHDYLQIVASHYTLDEENSERLMLKYYEYLLIIKNLVRDRFNMNILENLQDFPLHIDETLQEYYDKIAEKLCSYKQCGAEREDKYYIQKIKPFFVDQEIYYEVTFTPANDFANKTNRVIAFTKIKITDYYAVRLKLTSDKIEIIGKTMPINIIIGWEVAIRDCEYKNFVLGFNGKKKIISYAEQKAIGKLLTDTGFNLCDFLTFNSSDLHRIKEKYLSNVKNIVFFNVFKQCGNIVKNHLSGANLIRYLLFHMNNKIIKMQMQTTANSNLSNLYFQNGCIPFDSMPFCSSLIGHNPKLGDLFECIPSENRKHELFARYIRNNTEIKGQLFTKIKDINEFDNIPALVEKYNNSLWFGHREHGKLVMEYGQIFINGYKNNTCSIIEKLQELSSSGIQNYSSSVESWLKEPTSGVDCPEKKEALLNMFEESKVAVIYGSAGTGKSTLIDHVSRFFSDKRKLFLAQTNPAVDNLKRRVSASNCTFSTIASYLYKRNRIEYDLIIIDECSTVSNEDMCKILQKDNFQLLLLVGDTFQINSIRFGNWFSVINAFIPASSVFELTTPYRSNDDNLKLLWNRVRNMDDKILELDTRQKYSITLDSSIFNSSADDEIVLCLNYDGLYGINNINRFLQESNPNLSVTWGIQQYKEGDPILFNESERFSPIIYNNMKGKIIKILKVDENEPGAYIQFDIELEKVLNGMDVTGQDFELLDNSENGNSIIRFKVYQSNSADEDDYDSSRTVIPFQIAYAVSIHKAQGLEYTSVKLVITDEVDELITHSIFYTAITRARNKLKIYWTPEVENKVLMSLKPKNSKRDIELLRKFM